MTQEEKLYHEIAGEIQGAKESKMFGALCIKASNGKAGVMFWENDMVFKLADFAAQEVLQLDGVKMFEPSPGRAMNGWYRVPAAYSGEWRRFAVISMELAANIEPAKTMKKK